MTQRTLIAVASPKERSEAGSEETRYMVRKLVKKRFATCSNMGDVGWEE